MPLTRILRHSFSMLVLAAASVAVTSSSLRPEPQVVQGPVFDWLFVDGRVMDGSGNPWFRADVAVKDDRIVAIGDLSAHRARRRVSIAGKLLVPGFIDIHSHADDETRGQRGLRSGEPRRRAAPNLVSQGITTVVVNQDGRSPWPIREQRRALEERGIGPNAILLAGHGTIRRRVMKDGFRRAARQDEIDNMRGLLRQALQEGAMGLSAGLEYVPGRWSTTEELAALAAELPAVQGVYIAHQRSEGADPMWYEPSHHPAGPPSLLDAVRETIEIGRQSGAIVVASHIKAKGLHYWGSGQAAIRMIERARSQGLEVWADQYPYDTTGSDGATVLIPRWAAGSNNAAEDAEGKKALPYAQDLRKILGDPAEAARLRQDIAHEIARRGGADRIVIFDHPDKNLIQKSLLEAAAIRALSPVDMAIKLQLEGYGDRRGGARLRGFSLSEDDIDAYMTRPWLATSSDAGVALPEDGPVHARFYGTFPRKIRRYVLDRQVISLEQAIRSSTSLPALILRLTDRGVIREGALADLVVLDLEKLRDKATFTKPHQHAEGVDYVLVNGRPVVEHGRLTGALPGRVLTRRPVRNAPATDSHPQ